MALVGYLSSELFRQLFPQAGVVSHARYLAQEVVVVPLLDWPASAATEQSQVPDVLRPPVLLAVFDHPQARQANSALMNNLDVLVEGHLRRLARCS